MAVAYSIILRYTNLQQVPHHLFGLQDRMLKLAKKQLNEHRMRGSKYAIWSPKYCHHYKKHTWAGNNCISECDICVSKIKLPDIQIIPKELCIEVTQHNAKVHLCYSNQDRHLHLQWVEKRQLTSGTTPLRIHTKRIGRSHLNQAHWSSIAIMEKNK